MARLTGRHPTAHLVISAAPHARKDVLDAWGRRNANARPAGRRSAASRSDRARGTAVDRVAGHAALGAGVTVMLCGRAATADARAFLKFADMAMRVVDSATCMPSPDWRMAALREPKRSSRTGTAIRDR